MVYAYHISLWKHEEHAVHIPVKEQINDINTTHYNKKLKYEHSKLMHTNWFEVHSDILNLRANLGAKSMGNKCVLNSKHYHNQLLATNT